MYKYYRSSFRSKTTVIRLDLKTNKVIEIYMPTAIQNNNTIIATRTTSCLRHRLKQNKLIEISKNAFNGICNDLNVPKELIYYETDVRYYWIHNEASILYMTFNNLLIVTFLKECVTLTEFNKNLPTNIRALSYKEYEKYLINFNCIK